MNKSNLQYELQNEQMMRVVAVLEGLFVSVFAVITALLLPQLLFQFLIQGGGNISSAAWIGYVPSVSYGVAAFFFLWSMAGNFLRSRRIRELKQDLELMNYTASADVEIESEALAAALAEAQEETKSKPKRKTRSSSKKKTSTKKSSSKKKTTSKSASKSSSSKSSKKSKSKKK